MDASARPWLAQPTAREARSEALFASTLQPSDAPTADMIASAISCAVQRLGTRGCAGKMAQEFGDHPDLAAERRRWARRIARRAETGLHGTQDRAARRSGTDRYSQHPKEARRALAVIATAQLIVVLDATIVPNTRPPNQRNSEQSDVHLEQRPDSRPRVRVIGARGALGALVEGLRLDYRLVVGHGDFQMAASSAVVFAEALLGRDGRVSAQPGAWYPEEVLSLNRVEASLRRAGIDVTKTDHDRVGSASVR